MKGIIWKYRADPDDTELRDGMLRIGCRVLNPDPDFWENRFPVWAICGPQVRGRLAKGDVLVFAPTAGACRAAKVREYLCTGYLTVREVLPDDKAVLKDPRLTPRYRHNYRTDLYKHLASDPAITRRQRRKHIIIGDLRASRWLGRHGIALPKAITQARIRALDLGSRRIRTLGENEIKALLSVIRQHHSSR